MSENENLLYINIYNYLIDEINCGNFDKGEKLPSEKELCEKFHVSRITSKKALDMLSNDGLIKRMKGRGSFLINEKDALKSMPNKKKPVAKNKVLIGIVIPDFSEAYGLGIISGIEEACKEHGSFFTLIRSIGDLKNEEKVIDSLLELGVSGIGIMPVHGEFYNPKILQLILDGFPTVVMDRKFRGINACFVGTDNIGGAKIGTSYLLELGHKNISFISPSIANTSTLEDRERGIVEAYLEHNIYLEKKLWYNKLKSVLPKRNDFDTIQSDKKKLTDHFKNHPEITAVFASEYNCALLVREVLLGIGKEIPSDVSILCFDSPYTFINNFEFTHIKQNQVEIGKNVVSCLIGLIKDKNAIANSTINLEGSLVIGRSTTIVTL